MILRTANGSLFRVERAEGERMIENDPYDYEEDRDVCEVCLKDNFSVLQAFTRRICHYCYIRVGGTEEGWETLERAQELHDHLYEKLIAKPEREKRHV